MKRYGKAKRLSFLASFAYPRVQCLAVWRAIFFSKIQRQLESRGKTYVAMTSPFAFSETGERNPHVLLSSSEGLGPLTNMTMEQPIIF